MGLAHISVACLVLALASVKASDVNSTSENELVSSRDNYVITNVLSDGEVERRVKFNGVTAKETAVSMDSDGKTSGMKIRQVAEGKKFIQIIYASGRLLDCEYVHHAQSAKDFVERFEAETEVYVDKFHLKEGNVTVQHVRFLKDMDGAMKELLNYRRLRRSCKRLHRYIMKFQQQPVRQGNGNLTSHDDDSDRPKREIIPTSPPLTKNNRFDALMPGTKWCGSGQRAEQWKDVGSYSGADLCCRQHDHCPFKINGLATDFGYFNYRLFTVSHCDCDERFRTCLKMTNSAASNMVGKIFFNVIQTKCFVLKPDRSCSKRSWWGKCLKEELEMKAHIRDSLNY